MSAVESVLLRPNEALAFVSESDRIYSQAPSSEEYLGDTPEGRAQDKPYQTDYCRPDNGESQSIQVDLDRDCSGEGDPIHWSGL